MIKYPKGYPNKYGHLKLAIDFPEGLFKDIIKMAKAEEKTFSEMVVELCRCGKLCIEESDAHEPRKTSAAARTSDNSRIIRGQRLD